MKENFHVRFLGEKGSVTILTYPPNVHYDVKQIFGIKEGHMRLEQHVQAHLKFVYFLYQTYLKYKILLKKRFDFNLTARMLFDHISHPIERVPDPLQSFLGE